MQMYIKDVYIEEFCCILKQKVVDLGIVDERWMKDKKCDEWFSRLLQK